jgi:Family of unknown function (DUF6668)
MMGRRRSARPRRVGWPTLPSPAPDLFDPPPPDRRLPTRAGPIDSTARPAWIFVGAHGGAGASTLARFSHEHDPNHAGLDGGRGWPDPAAERTQAVVFVARTHMAGLAWARDVARAYLAGLAPAGLHLVGLVLVPDEPSRLPRPLTAAADLLTGAYPRIWRVPYQPDLRLVIGPHAETWTPAWPDLREALTDIADTVTEGDAQ